MKLQYKKEYTIKKGQEDWRVWHRVNTYLFDLMIKKRRARYRERILKKPVKVKVEVYF